MSPLHSLSSAGYQDPGPDTLAPGTVAALVQREGHQLELHWHEHAGGPLHDLCRAYRRMGYTIQGVTAWSRKMPEKDRDGIRRQWRATRGDLHEARTYWQDGELIRLYGSAHVGEDDGVFCVGDATQPDPGKRPKLMTGKITHCKVLPYAATIDQIREELELMEVEDAFDAWMARCERAGRDRASAP